MGQPVMKLSSAARRWHNQLPAWILQDPNFKQLRQQFRHTLQAIANACDAPSSSGGSLRVAFGGRELIEAAGCSPATFWRHCKRLEQLGYVVLLGRGGTIGSRNYGNQYGIPGRPGGLDHCRCRHEWRRMVRGPDGKLRPEVVRPGEQPSLWSPTPKKWDGGSLKVGRGSSHSETPPSHIPPPGYETTMVSSNRSTAKKRTAQAYWRVPAGALDNPRSLMDLFAEAVDLGIIAGSDHARLYFVSAAVHARRMAKTNPPGLFASIIRTYPQQSLYISQVDEDQARRWLRQAGATG